MVQTKDVPPNRNAEEVSKTLTTLKIQRNPYEQNNQEFDAIV
jgi:hypothetical protein